MSIAVMIRFARPDHRERLHLAGVWLKRIGTLGYIYALSSTYGGPPSIVETILAALAFCAFLVLYVRHRMVFGRRLYELAIVHTIPDSCVDEGAKAFFEAGQAWKALTET